MKKLECTPAVVDVIEWIDRWFWWSDQNVIFRNQYANSFHWRVPTDIRKNHKPVSEILYNKSWPSMTLARQLCELNTNHISNLERNKFAFFLFVRSVDFNYCCFFFSLCEYVGNIGLGASLFIFELFIANGMTTYTHTVLVWTIPASDLRFIDINTSIYRNNFIIWNGYENSVWITSLEEMVLILFCMEKW